MFLQTDLRGHYHWHLIRGSYQQNKHGIEKLYWLAWDKRTPAVNTIQTNAAKE